MKGGSHCGAKLSSIWGGFCFCIVSNYCRAAVLGSSRQGLVGLLKNIASTSELPSSQVYHRHDKEASPSITF